MPKGFVVKKYRHYYTSVRVKSHNIKSSAAVFIISLGPFPKHNAFHYVTISAWSDYCKPSKKDITN